MIRALIASLVLVAAVACGEKPATSDKPRDSATAGVQPASAASNQPAADPSNSTAPPPAAGVPADRVAADSAPATSSGEITGKVLETMDSGGYTYIKLGAGGGEVWAAVNQAPVKKGQTVTVVNAVQMDGFESKTLHRKFDHILFGSLAQPSGATAVGAKGGPAAGNATAPKGSALPPGHPNTQDDSMQKMVAAQHAAAGMGAGAQEVGKIEVAKAGGADGHTVAEVFAKKTALKDRPVEVRGKVVKFLPQIMGKNWIHLRDGSGSPEKKNNDLTVTTKDSANVGDVVVVRGTVKVDRDLGAGYQYPVLIEEAKVSK